MRKAAEGAEVGAWATSKRRQAKFVSTLAQTCNVSGAARTAGVATSTCYRWRAQDAGFAAAWDAALAIGYDRLEAALLDYALEKIERGTVDPAIVQPDEVKGSVAAALAERSINHADLQFAVGMLARHRAASAEGVKRGAKTKGLVTRAEADAALRRALDGLSRRVKPS